MWRDRLSGISRSRILPDLAHAAWAQRFTVLRSYACTTHSPFPFSFCTAACLAASRAAACACSCISRCD